jgi:hypothetical protein
MRDAQIGFPVAGIGTAALMMSAAVGHAGEPLTAAQLRHVIAGHRVFVETPFGAELPLFYGADGHLAGTAGMVSLAGITKRTDSGRWWIAGTQLCQKWHSWDNGSTSCVTVSADGSGRVSWVRSDGIAGRARIAP